MLQTSGMLSHYFSTRQDKNGNKIDITIRPGKMINHPRKQTVEFHFYRFLNGSVDQTLVRLEENFTRMGLYARLLKSQQVEYHTSQWPFNRRYWMAEYRISDQPGEASEVIS